MSVNRSNLGAVCQFLLLALALFLYRVENEKMIFQGNYRQVGMPFLVGCSMKGLTEIVRMSAARAGMVDRANVMV